MRGGGDGRITFYDGAAIAYISLELVVPYYLSAVELPA